MPFENAVVLPLATSTSAAGLYQKEHLNLPLPEKGAKRLGRTLLVYGASSSVGSAAVQLAIGSGFDVVATASKQNLDYVKSLGVTAAIDHSSPTIEDELVSALSAGPFAGIFDAISKPETIKLCVRVGERLGGCQLAPVLQLGPEFYTEKVTANPEYSKRYGIRLLIDLFANAR